MEKKKDKSLIIDERMQPIKELLQRLGAEKPATEDLIALKKELRNHPQQWRPVWDLALRAQRDFISSIAGKSYFTKFITQSGIDDIRKEYGYEKASATERMLIDHIVVTWLQYHKTLSLYEEQMEKNIAPRQARVLERRLSAAQQRYLRAIHTLAKIRKLGSSIQINIAEKQINQIR